MAKSDASFGGIAKATFPTPQPMSPSVPQQVPRPVIQQPQMGKRKKLGKVAPIQKSLMSGGR